MCSLHIQTPTQVLHEETRNTHAAEEQICKGGNEIFVSRQTQTIVRSLSCPWLDFRSTDDKRVNTVCASSWQRNAGTSPVVHLQQPQLLFPAHIQGPPSCAPKAKGTHFCYSAPLHGPISTSANCCLQGSTSPQPAQVLQMPKGTGGFQQRPKRRG